MDEYKTELKNNTANRLLNKHKMALGSETIDVPPKKFISTCSSMVKKNVLICGNRPSVNKSGKNSRKISQNFKLFVKIFPVILRLKNRIFPNTVSIWLDQNLKIKIRQQIIVK